MKDGWVPIEVRESLDEMLDTMMTYTRKRVGWPLLLCNESSHTVSHVIPGTGTRPREQGRGVPAEIESRKPSPESNRLRKRRR